jgi:hypothetical protein
MGVPFTQDWLAREPYRSLHPHFLRAVSEHGEWPLPEQYDALAQRVPRAKGAELPRFIREDRAAVSQAGGYEPHVATLRAVPTRPESFHDFFNMAVWAHFPKLRWALNALHVDPNVGPVDPRNGRAPAQNAAATFDESGMVVLGTSAEILAELRALRFRHAFWERREELCATTRYWVVGHGLLESLLVPRQGLVGRALFIQVSELPNPLHDEPRFALDSALAAAVSGFREARPIFDPLPVLAIPGFSANDTREFYDDPRNVRFVPISRRPT